MGVEGLALILDFVTEEEEEQLIKDTASEPEERWTKLSRTKRRVLHLAYAFDYDRKTVG